ncbi:glycosyltransferase family 2 protein, partial [Xanthovirga aplysinae]|uniref:glycosyltransferase family 2 protein n=1 Tax=Xanthovirga aplysinae TaxID=2529853 RepID=UPI0012BCBA16
MPPNKISVTVITKNSQKTLSRCLKALKDFDEIILLDNGSTDNTFKIASSFPNVRTFRHEFIGFGPLKRLASSYASNDWILSIDSDEVVSNRLAKSLLNTHLEENTVYSFLFKNYYKNKHINACGWENNIKNRLYNRKHTNFTQNKIHEHIDITKSKTIQLKGHLDHYPYHSVSDLIKKGDLYTELFAKENRFRKKASALKAFYKGAFSFFRNYILNRGFLYGAEGLLISIANASGTFYKYIKLREYNKNITTSLIISTYNWKEALELALIATMKQKVLPTEVIVADDGSKEDTKAILNKYAKIFPVPLIHCWQSDNGFRLAKIRNKAIALAKHEYIIQIDGDIIAHPNFIKDHIRFARPKSFVKGSRVLLNTNATKNAFQEKKINFHFFQKGITNRLNNLHFPWLSKLFDNPKANIRGIRGANLAFWKEDAFLVNGYNEDIEGWGREDSEMVARLVHNGVKKRTLKLGGIAYHLYHKQESHSTLSQNDEILKNTLSNKLKHC